jgi:tetraacyldisaccharide 4'-kinase
LLQAWRRRGLVARALLPVAAIYSLANAIRRVLFQIGFFRVHRVEAAVIVVGNVITGGAGKTPTVIAIARHLAASGLNIGVVSRGYGRADHQVRAVDVTSTPEEVGDEPLLIFKTVSCPVYVGPGRYDAACALLAAHPAVDVILCDDGLQHYSLYRNLEVLVFDERGVGNGWVLPAGPLRESWPRQLVSKCGQMQSRTLTLHTGRTAAFAGFRASRSLAPYAISRDGRKIPLENLDGICIKPLFAVAGLARPEAFFDMLVHLRLPLAGTLGLSDHFDFRNFDPALGQRHTLLCTEKDATKLWRIAPDALAIPLVQSIEDDFWSALDTGLSLPSGAPLSSEHGHKTA